MQRRTDFAAGRKEASKSEQARQEKTIWRKREWVVGGLELTREGPKSRKESISDLTLQRCEKRLVNLVKQNPGRVRQNS